MSLYFLTEKGPSLWSVASHHASPWSIRMCLQRCQQVQFCFHRQLSFPFISPCFIPYFFSATSMPCSSPLPLLSLQYREGWKHMKNLLTYFLPWLLAATLASLRHIEVCDLWRQTHSSHLLLRPCDASPQNHCNGAGASLHTQPFFLFSPAKTFTAFPSFSLFPGILLCPSPWAASLLLILHLLPFNAYARNCLPEQLGNPLSNITSYIKTHFSPNELPDILKLT